MAKKSMSDIVIIFHHRDKKYLIFINIYTIIKFYKTCLLLTLEITSFDVLFLRILQYKIAVI